MRPQDFDSTVARPPGLTIAAIRNATDYIERELAGLLDIYFEQANLFSGLVSIYGTRALDIHSVYEKHRHRDLAAQRFPDLRRRGSGDHPLPQDSLESKASIRPWALQAHYDHPGWYIIWRYLIDTTGGLRARTAGHCLADRPRVPGAARLEVRGQRRRSRGRREDAYLRSAPAGDQAAREGRVRTLRRSAPRRQAGPGERRLTPSRTT